MTAPEPQRTAAATTAHRLAALLLGMGVLHFAAPKPFDTIIPTELPGTPRFYTYASGVGELATERCWRHHARGASARWRP